MISNARGTHSSPGIYTREVDVSQYSSRALGITTLGLVGETLIGPAFQPIPISTYSEFLTYFGGTSAEKYLNKYPKYELGYIAKSYLQESQQLYVTRVLGLSGYQYKGLYPLFVNSGSTRYLLAIVRPKSFYSGETLTTTVTGVTLSENPTGLTQSFNILINGVAAHAVSLDSSAANYILKVLSSDPLNNASSKIFIEEMYEDVLLSFVDTGTTKPFKAGVTVQIGPDTAGFNDYRTNFKAASTPYFVSQVKGNAVLPLFRFYTLSDGNSANNLFKVSIENIDPSTLKFDVLIRAINDTDESPTILERYTSCTLDPDDGSNYIGAKIGTADELYVLKSKYVVIDIVDDERVKDSVPMGFGGYDVKNITGYTQPSLAYNTSYVNTGNLRDKKRYFGVTNTVDTDMFTYKGVSGLTQTKGFHLEPSAASIGSGYVVLTGSTYADYVSGDITLRKFTAYFAGGFDGWDIFRTGRTNTDSYQFNNYVKSNQIGGTNSFKFFDASVANSIGVPAVTSLSGMTSDYYAFWSAVRTFADPEAVDINIFATPGIDWYNNTLLVNEVIYMIEEERKDSIYVITTPDKPSGADDLKASMFSASDIANSLNGKFIDTSYGTTQYPWVQYYDADNGKYIYLPVTKDVVRNMAYTDNTTYAWFPPAGVARGNVQCVKAKKSLLLSEENILYSNRINMVKTFAQDGIKVWGQKTLQVEDTSLNRIGVRRMMLYVRKLVRRSNLPLIFEPNDDTTKTRFLEIVNPILNSVKTNRGISDFKIVIDDSVEARERHEMPVKIWLKPIGALEYISIDFMITSEGFDFSTI